MLTLGGGGGGLGEGEGGGHVSETNYSKGTGIPTPSLLGISCSSHQSI